METEAPKPQSTVRIVPLRATEPPGPSFEELADQALRIALGLATTAAAVLTSAVLRTMRPEPAPEAAVPDGEPVEPEGFPLLAGAAFGLALESGRLAFRAAEGISAGLRPWASFLMSPNVVRRRLADAKTLLRTLDDRWRDEQPDREDAATAFARGLVPQVANAVLDQIDLTELALAHLDLDRVVDGVDLDRILHRIDLNEIADGIDIERILDRVDVDAIVEQVDVQRIIDRVDLNEVAAKIDVDAVAARVDLDAIVSRIDVVAIAQHVIDELDLVDLIRKSTETVTTETVEGIRVQGINADQAVSRIFDRALGRRTERATGTTDDQEGAR
jgi:hypothetical protein